MLGLGLTGTLYRTMYGTAGASLHTPTIAPRRRSRAERDSQFLAPRCSTNRWSRTRFMRSCLRWRGGFIDRRRPRAARRRRTPRGRARRGDFTRPRAVGARFCSAARWAASAAARSCSRRSERSRRECRPAADSSRSRSSCSAAGLRSASPARRSCSARRARCKRSRKRRDGRCRISCRSHFRTCSRSCCSRARVRAAAAPAALGQQLS